MKVPVPGMENSGQGSWILLEGWVKDFYFGHIAFKQVSNRQLAR